MTAPTRAGVPVVAEDPYDDANLADPYPLFERMRDAGPVVWLEKYAVHAFTRFDPCREILLDHETFISGAGVGPRNFHHQPSWRPQGILDSDPPVHTPLRTAMAGVISPRNVRSLRARFQVFAERLVEELVRQREFDAVTEMAEVFPIEVFGDAVGIPREGREENLLAHGAMNFSQFGPEDARYETFFAKGEPTIDWVMDNCARDNLTKDGLGAQIWEYADNGSITPDEATRLVRALLSAGVDTTIFAIGNAIQCLAANPDQWALLHSKPTLTKFAVDEALRYDSPFQSFFRTTGRDVDFHGLALPEDTKIALFMGAANRDPRRWGDDAGEYRITRDAGGHLAFGMGIHQCVGQPISRLEMDVLLTELAKRVARIELVGEPQHYLHNTLRGWTSVPVRVVPA
jgi:cytochrome P450